MVETWILSVACGLLVVAMLLINQRTVAIYREDYKILQEQNNQLINMINFKQPIVPEDHNLGLTEEARQAVALMQEQPYNDEILHGN